MSQLLTLKGRSSTLSTDFSPPIRLNPNYSYGLALLSFHSYNSIPNVEKGSEINLVRMEKGKEKERRVIKIPEGSYEILDIEKYIRRQLNLHQNDEATFSLKPNNNTLKCEIFSNLYSIDFQRNDSLANILGFSKRILPPNVTHSSDLPVKIIKVRTAHLDCSITVGAFHNSRPSHTIYEFAIESDPGFAIDETPRHPIYLPVLNKEEIYNITIKVLDQDFQPVNFRGEEIIVRLELKPQNVNNWG